MSNNEVSVFTNNPDKLRLKTALNSQFHTIPNMDITNRGHIQLLFKSFVCEGQPITRKLA